MGYGVSQIDKRPADRYYNGAVSVDKVTMSAVAKITVRPDDIKPTVGETALAAGGYTSGTKTNRR